ncbi:MAG: trigger factor [Firmicutes bacterium]|nr:trigger factor [Bacillota bacterium]
MKRKILAILLSLTFVFAFTACGDSKSSMSYDDYNLDEYLDVGDYKGLEVAPYKVSVSQDEIDADVKSTLEAAAKDVDLTKDDEIKKGDTVNIDYVGKIDGKEFEGGSAEGSDLEIGSGSFIEGFEDGLIGKKIGDKVDLNLQFPESYGNKDVAGKDVVFSVTINSAKRSVAPTEEAFVKENAAYESVEDFEKAVKKKLKNKKEEQAIMDQKQSLWSDALDNTTVNTYPDREVDAYKELNSSQIDKYAESYGVSREDMLKQYGFEKEEDFTSVNEDSSKLRVKQEMLIEYIAAKEGIEYTDKEAEEMLQQMKDSGYDEDSIKEQTGREAEDYIHIELLYEKVLDFLLENADVTGAAKEY